jgi:hypothetical protein
VNDEDYQTRVNEYKLLYQQGVSNPTLSITNAPMNLYPNNPFYAQRRANGGRIGKSFRCCYQVDQQVVVEEDLGI